MTVAIYIHGKGGSAAESEHYKPLFPNCEVTGVDYLSETPWEAGPEIRAAIQNLSGKYDDIILIANSIGAFFSLHAEIGGLVRKAFFISPVVDMETVNGVELNGKWLDFVRSHPVNWDVPTHILYGSKDNLIPSESIRKFAEHHNATLTVMENGEHWFHTEDQMLFLDNWIREYYSFITLRDRPTFRPMRRFKQALPEEECFRILENACRGFLSVNGDGGYPYSVPINFVFEDGKLYFHCAKEGHKLDAIRACNKACFTVLDEPEKEPGDWWYHVKSVICFGRVGIVADERERLHRLRSLAGKYFPADYDTETDLLRNGPKAEILVFTIEHISGKAVREK